MASERAVPVEELVQFPTRFAFKAVGAGGDAFADAAQAAVQTALGAHRAIELRRRPSRHGTYLAVTLTTQVEDADELRKVYAGLRAVPGVITVL